MLTLRDSSVAMPRSPRHAFLVAVFALLLLTVLLLAPDTGGRLRAALETAAHFVLFLGLGWSAVVLVSRRRLAWRRPLLAVVLLAVAMEAAEWLADRAPAVLDIGASAAGGLAGVAVAVAWRLGSRLLGALAVALASMLGAAAVAPAAMVLADRAQAYLAFPLLASFEGRTEVSRWWEHHCRVSRVKTQATHGAHALRVVLFKSRGRYPGIFMTDGRRDWGDYGRLCFDIYLTGNASRSLWIRADDRAGDPPYADRAQTLVDLAPGANSVCLDLPSFLRTPSGRDLDRRHIVRWGMFVDEAAGGETFIVDHVRLTR